MNRPSIASLALALVVFASLVACGGDKKPPMTPDEHEVSAEGAEAGAPDMPASGAEDAG